MRFGLGLAISVSVLLITVASWTRFGQAQEYSPGLVAVTQPIENSDEYYKELAGVYMGEGAVSSSSQETLSTGEIIGRQLIFDYIELATKGQASEENLKILADKYAESIPTIQQSTSIKLLDLQIVANTYGNFKSYNDTMNLILEEYRNKIRSGGSANQNNNLGPGLYSFAAYMSRLYGDTALKMKNIPVPQNVSLSHQQLVNNYLANSAAMKSISETEEDPANSFSGLIMLNANLENETNILNEINVVLESNGV